MSAEAHLPDVDAIVSYETRQVLSNGVTRIESWSERLVRSNDTIWTERVRPGATGSRLASERAESAEEHLGHKHFNADTAARWLSKAADGTIELRFVDQDHRAVVSVPRAEYGTVGFDGSFNAAASVVPENIVRAMKPALGPTVAGARWLVDRSDGWMHRVLWSDSHQLALKVESVREDGSARRVVAVKLTPTHRTRVSPWNQLGGYAQKRYDDFMD